MIGIDVVKIERIKKAAESTSFWRVFSASEKEYIETKTDKFSTMAGLYAAKEAAAKALGRGFRDLRPNILEVLHDANGCPYIYIEGKTIMLSISHDGDYAAAAAFLEVCSLQDGKNNSQDINCKLPAASVATRQNNCTCALQNNQNAELLINKLQEIVLVTEEDAFIPKRERFTHKGDYASVFIIGGSGEMPGAPLMSYESAEAALKNGAGLLRLCVPESLKAAYQARVKQETLLFLPDDSGKVMFDAPVLDSIIKKADSIVIGPGMGENPEILKIIGYLCQNFDKILIVDADGLNALACDLSVLKNHKCRLILTPHIGEFLRLTDGLPSALENKNQSKTAEESIEKTVEERDLGLAYKAADFALKHDCVVVLKSAYSFITDGVRIYKNTTGTAAMAKGGSGDILAGIIAAFSGFMTPLRACLAGCYRLGLSGEAAEKAKGQDGVTAEDLYLK